MVFNSPNYGISRHLIPLLDTAPRWRRSLLARVYQILKAKVRLEDELDALKRTSAGHGPAVTPSRPVTRSGAAAAAGPPISAPTKPADMADTRKVK